MTTQAQAPRDVRDAELEALRAQVQRLSAELAAERSARQKAEREGQLKDEFLADVAHELRAPLGAILGWVHLLAGRGSEEEFATGIEVIEQSVQVQAKLIDDLLAIGRMAAGKTGLQMELLDPRGFVDAALDALRPAAAGKEMRIRKVFDSAPGLVRGDATRLQQVMTNLLTNALKFTPSRGWIEVSLRRSAGWATITVADNGVGIAPEFLPHVFDRFRQAPAAAPSLGGLGLGLAIARQLVELHGGEIEAHSAGEGRGATFTVRLPLADTARQRAAPRA